MRKMVMVRIQQRKGFARMVKRLTEGETPERMHLVLPRSMLLALDEWRAQQRPPMNRSEAVRSILGLEISAIEADLIPKPAA